MRDIKFRAWWNKGMYYQDQFGKMTFSEGNVHVLFLNHKRGENFECGDTWTRKDDYILMQYTGLKDKNGVDSYHKDICTGNWPYADKCIIEWDDKRCGFYFQPINEDGSLGKAAYDKGYKLNANKFEIIGNVYEHNMIFHQHPELLI